jgi:ubiquinone/menaquinone biosynthesis C-methylase UbiE
MTQPVAVSAVPTSYHPHFDREVERIMLPLKQRTYTLMEIANGSRVLDVGCGPASDTIALADRVGRDGFVIGIDSDKSMIAEAERRAISAGVGERVRHRTVNTLQLPFCDGEFDAVRCERTFQFLETPEIAMQEIVRVTKPGGTVVVADVDWAAGTIDTPHPRTEVILQDVLARSVLPNGYAGRTLFRLMKQAGLANVATELHPFSLNSLPMIRLVAQLDYAEEVALDAGLLSAEEIEQWRADLERYAEEGMLFAAVSVVVAVGKKREA